MKKHCLIKQNTTGTMIKTASVLSRSHGCQTRAAGEQVALVPGTFATFLSNGKFLTALRPVTTTSTSKTQQVVQKKERYSLEEHEAENPQAYNYEKYRERSKHLNIWHSVDNIKRLGYRVAQLDPLNLRNPESFKDISWAHNMVEQLRKNTNIVPTHGFLDTKQPLMAVNELIDAVWNIYTNTDSGIEFMHMSNEQEVEWLTSQWEKLNEIFHLDQPDQYNIAELLLQADAFDQFLASKFPTVKRYGCSGADSMLVVLDETLRLCHLGIEDMDEMTRSIGRIDDVVVGSPHRGRLSMLACVLGFDPTAIFSKMLGESELDLSKAWMAKGDVLSHLSTNLRFVYGIHRPDIGFSRTSPDPINVTLLPNPSHLEIVSPMTAGTARGRAHNVLHRYSSSPKFSTMGKKSSELDNPNRDYKQYFQHILPIQIHGDAAVAGQGIIQETLQMSNLPDFTVGGSMHLVVNNQIGFTTPSEYGRSSRHCTDIFKMIEAPIIHVNAQNISSVVRATRLALMYRQKFGKDVVIDLICYRQHGHNEMDEPAFTQPVMYSNIRQRKSITQTYCDEIGMPENERKLISNSYRDRLSAAYKQVDRYKPDNENYRNFKLPTEYHRDHLFTWRTGCDLSTLRSVALASVDIPQNFEPHSNLERVLIQERRQKFDVISEEQLKNVKVDWATAEILAFGSLLKQDHSVRIAGQDVGRGTFSTRHAVLYDQLTNQPYIPLNKINDPKGNNRHRAQLEVANTILSEEAALAYEFGYSAETCELTIWEAQFGDFFNTAQSILDTLVSSSESKWLKQSPLTILLPHGLDGAGPEHSSSHLERFLQSSSSSQDSIDTEARVNWSVCFPTEPSQYFHLLRRQIMRPFRKPLIVMSPKSIFRHPDCISDLSKFSLDKTFEPILNDPNTVDKHAVDSIVLCTGKVYYSLADLKRKNQMDNVAIIRIEELCPFPMKSVIQTIKQYPNVNTNNIVWFQEEHKNQGAFNFVDTRLQNIAGIKMNYIGRSESELPATGIGSMHRQELDQIVKLFQSLKSV